MSDEVKQLWTCPACGVRSLVDHCQSPTCTWHMCRSTVCQLVVDLKQRFGHRLIPGTGKREKWVLPA